MISPPSQTHQGRPDLAGGTGVAGRAGAAGRSGWKATGFEAGGATGGGVGGGRRGVPGWRLQCRGRCGWNGRRRLSRERLPLAPRSASPRSAAGSGAAETAGHLGRSGCRRRPARCRQGRRRRRGLLGGEALADDGAELAEEIVGHLLGRALDQPRADLGELAADIGLGAVAQDRIRTVLGEIDLRTALAKPAAPPLPSPEMR